MTDPGYFASSWFALLNNPMSLMGQERKWLVYRVGRELLLAGAAILGAFADLLGVLVRTLPHVMLAGVIALGGVWVINHLDNSLVRMPTWLQASEQTSSPENRQSSPPSGQQSNPPQDQR